MTRRVLARALASASRLELLHMLQDHGPSTAAELAAATGLHHNTVREHLGVLIDVDLVRKEAEHRATRGRPRLVYRATSTAEVQADPAAQERIEEDIARGAVMRALVAGFEGLPDQEARAVAAGATVGRELPVAAGDSPERQVLALEAHLDSFGFDPQWDAEELTFELWRCPVLELAKERPEVVCGVHRGLAQGVLEHAGGPLEVAELTPFATPDHCTLRLRREIKNGNPGGKETAPGED